MDLDRASTSYRPFDPPGVLGRARPFLIGAGLAIILLGLPEASVDGAIAAAAIVATAAIVIAGFAVQWPSHATGWQSVPPLAYFGVIALLRDAAGGASSGYSPLIVLPVFWLSLYGTRKLVAVASVATAAVLVIPILLIGAPDYPETEWRRALIWLSIIPTIGFTVRSLVERVDQLARVDGLTGLVNRRGLGEELVAAMAVARRSGRTFSVALLDLDHFKAFNDERGHLAGDELLRDAARGWGDLVRDVDVLARYGGEEFCVVMPGAGVADAAVAVTRLLEQVPEGQTASAGVTQWVEGEDADSLLGRADAALYDAKAAGRNRLVVG